MVKPFILTFIKEFLNGIIHLGLNNLISDTKFLLLSTLSVFLPKECENSNTL